jgi:hypothetical protein
VLRFLKAGFWKRDAKQHSFFVLGTNHRLQGSPNYPKSVVDPDYERAIAEIISADSVDFIFEEASGCGRTTLARLAEKLGLPYLDVDPHPSLAAQFGIVDAAGDAFPDNISPEQKVDEDALREELWRKRICGESFQSGLLVCGFLHTLSVSFRLRSFGFRLKFASYVPHERLCTRPHCDG